MVYLSSSTPPPSLMLPIDSTRGPWYLSIHSTVFGRCWAIRYWDNPGWCRYFQDCLSVRSILPDHQSKDLFRASDRQDATQTLNSGNAKKLAGAVCGEIHLPQELETFNWLRYVKSGPHEFGYTMMSSQFEWWYGPVPICKNQHLVQPLSAMKPIGATNVTRIGLKQVSATRSSKSPGPEPMC